jgi:hypothetical protein
MKVLQNAARPGAVPQATPRPIPLVAVAAPPDETRVDASPRPRAAAPSAPAAPVRRPPRPRAHLSLGAGILVALIAAAAAVGCTLLVLDRVAEGALLVTSEPPGAAVTVDGVRAAGVTPVVVEGLRLAQPHVVAVSAPGRRPASVVVEPERRLVRPVHVALAATVAALRVESVPPGAEVRIDGRPAGTTPATIRDVRVDEPHRIDLTLDGHELDQFVVRPETDGTRFRRELVPYRRPVSATSP